MGGLRAEMSRRRIAGLLHAGNVVDLSLAATALARTAARAAPPATRLSRAAICIATYAYPTMGTGRRWGHIATKPIEEPDMSHLPQDLHDVFPNATEKLRHLKENDRHFRALADRYAALDDGIRRSETGAAPAMDDAHADELKRERLALLDQIAALLQGEQA
jgi:uncharacterized protein